MSRRASHPGKAGRLPVFLKPVSLITVPGSMALAIWALSLPVLVWGPAADAWLPGWTVLPYDTAVAVLGAIASAAITTLSLVYSMVLIVFTLAAGNIGPRLLRRFTTDRVNQVTAGVLGGTFLFSLTALWRTGPQNIPQLAVLCAMVLALISVLQLIYFVHSVSSSVTIDAEIARIAGQLEERLQKVLRREEIEEPDPASMPEDLPHVVLSAGTGYVAAIEEDALAETAAREDLYAELLLRPGDFVVEGEPLLRLSRDPGDEACDAMRRMVQLDAARGSVQDIGFSLSMLLEIALRALSPGVNDTFTAIACIDRLSGALADPMAGGLRGNLRAAPGEADEDGRARLRLDGMTLEDLTGGALHPLRRAATGNLLMAGHIAKALVRLHKVAAEEARPLLRDHAELLLEDAGANANPRDRETLERQLQPVLRHQ